MLADQCHWPAFVKNALHLDLSLLGSWISIFAILVLDDLVLVYPSASYQNVYLLLPQYVYSIKLLSVPWITAAQNHTKYKKTYKDTVCIHISQQLSNLLNSIKRFSVEVITTNQQASQQLSVAVDRHAATSRWSTKSLIVMTASASIT